MSHELWAVSLRARERRAESIITMEFRVFGGRFHRLTRKISRQLRYLERSLQVHTFWNLAKLLAMVKVPPLSAEGQILLILLSKEELGPLPTSDALFLGSNLAKAASRGPIEERHALECFRSQSPLLMTGLIQPGSGEDELLSDRQDHLARTSFELGDKALEILKLERNPHTGGAGDGRIRQPRVTMDQLVLTATARQALDMAVGGDVSPPTSPDNCLCEHGADDNGGSGCLCDAFHRYPEWPIADEEASLRFKPYNRCNEDHTRKALENTSMPPQLIRVSYGHLAATFYCDTFLRLGKRSRYAKPAIAYLLKKYDELSMKPEA